MNLTQPECECVRDVHVEDVKTGLGGATGNKGTVGISLTYHATSFVFLCSHFAAGQKEIQVRDNKSCISVLYCTVLLYVVLYVYTVM